MWLAVDCGNTRIKWGLLADSQPLDAKAVQVHATDDRRAYVHLKKTARLAKSAWVSGGATAKTRLLQSLSGCRLRVVRSTANGGGVTNPYRRPTTLGSDRWLNMVAAATQRRDVLIIDAGTAATIDALRGDGVFVGGIILPGVLLMQQNLAARTTLPTPTQASRPKVAPTASVTAIPPAAPLSTRDGMRDGALLSIAGAAALLRRQLLPKATYIVTGGNAQEILPYLPKSAAYMPYLPLHGLVRLRAMRYHP